MDFSLTTSSQSLHKKFTLKRENAHSKSLFFCAKCFSFYVGHMVANLQGKNKTQNKKITTANNNFPLRLAANKTYC